MAVGDTRFTNVGPARTGDRLQAKRHQGIDNLAGRRSGGFSGLLDVRLELLGLIAGALVVTAGSLRAE